MISTHPSPVAAGEWLHAAPYAQGKIRTRGGGLAKMTARTRVITFDDDRIYQPWLVELYNGADIFASFWPSFARWLPLPPLLLYQIAWSTPRYSMFRA